MPQLLLLVVGAVSFDVRTLAAEDEYSDVVKELVVREAVACSTLRVSPLDCVCATLALSSCLPLELLHGSESGKL